LAELISACELYETIAVCRLIIIQTRVTLADTKTLTSAKLNIYGGYIHIRALHIQ